MTLLPDQITRRKLLLVKQLYQHAALQAASVHSTVNRILSMVGFDLANETLLKTVVGALDPSKIPQDAFQPLVQQSEALLTDAGLGPVPDKPNVLHVHALRNDAQHKAKYPNASDVVDCRIYTRDFLRKLVSNVWDLDFEKLTLVEIIQNTKARQFLADAETAQAKGDSGEAVRNAAAALTWALLKIKRSIVGSLPTGVGLSVLLSDAFGKATVPSTETFDALEQMQDVIVYPIGRYGLCRLRPL